MAGKRIVRIILDTNWFVSASINRRSRRRLYELLTNKDVIILYSQEILEEYNKVMSRPKFQKIISTDLSKRFIRLVLPMMQKAEQVTQIELSRDKDDDYLLALSLDNNANYLITGDNDLLVLESVGNTKIVTMFELLELLADI